MRQLITRIDDDLHGRVKEKARSEGRSVNDLVRGLLEAAVADARTPLEWKRRMVSAGKVVVTEPAGEVPGRETVARLLRESGPALSDYLDWSRDEGRL